MSFTAIIAIAATALTAPLGDIYSDAPVVTNVTFEGLATTAELAPYAKKSELPSVPTKVGALENDAGYLTGESDPTVSAWAKAAAKPKYTASEVGAYTKAEADAKVSDVAGTADMAWNVATAVGNLLSAHEGRADNPHGVTAAQVGAYTKAEADAALAAKADASALAAKQDRPAATTAATSLSYRADGGAVSVSVADGGTLAATLDGWTDGQAQTALISLASGASVDGGISLVGYGSWPTVRFLASCVRVGSCVYVTPITYVAED